MRRTLLRVLPTLVCSGLALVGSAAAANLGPPSAKITGRLPAGDREVLARAVPGATARLVTGSDPAGGTELSITAPRSWPAFSPLAGGRSCVSRSVRAGCAAQLGWRSDMAATYAAMHLPSVTSFRVMTQGRRVSIGGSDWLQGPIRGAPGQPIDGRPDRALDTLPVPNALAQLRSSLSVVAQAYGPSVAMKTDASAVPLDLRVNAYGLEASIRVPRLSQLRPHLIDILAGLQTGLTGTGQSPVEGLAIDLLDNRGHQAGVWITVRSYSGGNVSSLGLDTAVGGTVDASFPNLTGGPPTLGITTGSGSY